MHKVRPRSAAAALPATLSRRAKQWLSVLLALHVAAVFIGPWAMPPHSSGFARMIAATIEPYLQVTFLDNGYRFFAPEPGPGHLVRYEVTTRDGRQIDGVFPDRATEWPRLLYHRYFMLSEFLNGLQRPEAVAVSDLYAESYASHLQHEYDAGHVKLFLRRHRLPTMEDVKGGKRLDDPSLYDEKLITEGSADEP